MPRNWEKEGKMKTKIKKWITFLFLASMLTIAYVTPAKAQYLPDEYTVGLWHLDNEFGTALSFDGIDDYVQVAYSTSLDITGAVTIEAWVYAKGSGRMLKIACKRETQVPFYFIGVDNGKLYAGISDETSYVVTDKVTELPLNEWHHIAMVYSDVEDKIWLYLDGELKETVTCMIQLVTFPSDLIIGAQLQDGNYYQFFDGLIDEVRISNAPRTSFDLLTPLTVDSDTVALWHFNEGDGQFVYDATDNGNDGQLGLTSDTGDDDPIWVDSTVNSTLAIDSSPNENHGTIYGATWVDLNIGNALSFDGIDDYVNIPDSNSLDIVGSITLEAWFKVTNFTALPHLYIVSKDTSGSRSYGIAINQEHSGGPSYTPGFVIFGPGGVPSIVWGTTTIQIDTWYHVMGVYDAAASEVRLYLNGVLESIKTNTVSSIWPGIADLQIGARQYPGVWRCFFNGVIDEVRISNDVRSPGLPVYIDIKPGTDPNDICLSKQGLLPVAILSTDNFDATQIEPSSLELGGVDVSERGSKKAPKTAYSIKDVDGDGDLDMMAFFSVPDLVAYAELNSTTVSLELTGTLLDAITPIVGIDSIRIVPE